MRKIETLRELQMAIFKVLCEVADVCEAQGFRYSLLAGSLLGAVRHKGFIPWDDDIDIAMPRPDYEALIEYCRTHETKFRLLCNKLEPKYGYVFAKAWDPATKIVEQYGNRNDVDCGVYVDIFPLDAAGDEYEEICDYYSKLSYRFPFELSVACNWKCFFRSFNRPWYIEPVRFAFYLMSRPVSFERLIPYIEKKFQRFEYGTTKYVMVSGSTYRMKDVWLLEYAQEFVDVEFEGRKFKLFKMWHEYLSHVYGNYMQLPPKEKQISHHDFDAYYL